MKEYETVYILGPRVAEQETQEVSERLSKIIASHKGKVLMNRSWGKKQIAFPIQKEKEGVFVQLNYAGGGTLVGEIERSLKLDEKVLRFLTVTLNEEVDVDKRSQELASLTEGA
ncbi:MAG: 30S ribosomal protein S6 [Deltaproteobacteria bacterium RIFCSPLOWO2_01_44_7]|nr:MAG: 30S ribosomal protein S6 [Deltaproteobacteria bacterium RIFCSPHIGHO2_01_FULL_43_49]OGQ15906.1 MAG: 30S ribosomal protein S6 [Deltaproteobacteria bacterium RIFCSPHIGHO2_02_FULL_44_53]OGQ28869.1 MAG: 30S ribosomal protein S6 [Deltaproteobacteria bacterium RIFCSPHIGHO2_12_FULL_44_21]OGQ30961.1 MAG: 30S ribosomal protein S6 [Deltaproteobacteria bacterium RIFCSPLOWO2_01_FULL_45_74]OGQ40203.1 MAG: 30S ribosomal protein S6 [Deltaproteobacteria bacterium RIFCSPLOWO2_01_44_7]OGQ43467.1 MAG: 30S